MTILKGRSEKTAADATMVEKFRLGNAEIWAIADSLGLGKRVPGLSDAEESSSWKTESPIMTFAVRLNDSLILFDTGFGFLKGYRTSRMMQGLEKAGLKPTEIDHILITHMHGDHTGGLIRNGKKAFPNAVVAVNRIELEFWLDDKSRSQMPENEFNFALTHQVAELYSDAIRKFEFGDEVLPGITALDTVGHTPGHTSFMLESGGQKLLIVGDLLHDDAMEIPADFDMFPEQAAAARKRLLEKAAKENLPIAGMHLTFASVGTVVKTDAESYAIRLGM